MKYIVVITQSPKGYLAVAMTVALVLVGCRCGDTGNTPSELDGGEWIDRDSTTGAKEGFTDVSEESSIVSADARMETPPIDGNRQDTAITADANTASSSKTWTPPFESDVSIWTDETGWKQSTEPFNSGKGWYPSSHNVWSDSRGVYTAVFSEGDAFAARDEFVKVYFNHGTGWVEIVEIDTYWMDGSVSLTGFPAGPLVVYGFIEDCVTMFVDDGIITCISGLEFVENVFVVNSTLAYAVCEDRVYRYDGRIWTQFSEPLKPAGDVHANAIWANERIVVVAANDQQVYIYREGDLEFELQNNIPAGHYQAVWGFEEDDIWAASTKQLIHFDGTDWELIWSDDNPCSISSGNLISGMWGSSGKLFFHTPHKFFVWDGAEVRILAHWPCNEDVIITDIWGNSPSEVFLSVVDPNYQAQAIMLWYDGSSLRQF